MLLACIWVKDEVVKINSSVRNRIKIICNVWKQYIFFLYFYHYHHQPIISHTAVYGHLIADHTYYGLFIIPMVGRLEIAESWQLYWLSKSFASEFRVLHLHRTPLPLIRISGQPQKKCVARVYLIYIYSISNQSTFIHNNINRPIIYKRPFLELLHEPCRASI